MHTAGPPALTCLPANAQPPAPTPILQLYERQGYAEVGRDPAFTPNRRCLMRKDVPRCQTQAAAAAPGSGSSSRTLVRRPSSSGTDSGGSEASGSGGAEAAQQLGSSGGVFMWSDLEVVEAAAEDQPPPQ